MATSNQLARDIKNLEAGLVEADRQSRAIQDGEIRLSTGVILKIKPVAASTITKVLARFEPPKVPVVYDTDRDREIPNPMHPDYLEGMKRYQSEQGFAMYDACCALGADIISAPEGFPPVDSNDWIEELQAIGIEFNPDLKVVRRMMWIEHVAARTTDDMTAIVEGVMRRAGVPEEDVNNALSSFRSDQGGNSAS